MSLIGENLPAAADAEVYFGETLVEVYELEADASAGTTLMVKFPTGGFSQVGMLNVTVRNKNNGTQDMKINGFEYVSQADPPKYPASCSGEAGSGSMPMGDLMVLLLAVGGLLIGLKRKSANRAAYRLRADSNDACWLVTRMSACPV